jgi:hypothetical protein
LLNDDKVKSLFLMQGGLHWLLIGLQQASKDYDALLIGLKTVHRLMYFREPVVSVAMQQTDCQAQLLSVMRQLLGKDDECLGIGLQGVNMFLKNSLTRGGLVNDYLQFIDRTIEKQHIGTIRVLG